VVFERLTGENENKWLVKPKERRVYWEMDYASRSKRNTSLRGVLP